MKNHNKVLLASALAFAVAGVAEASDKKDKKPAKEKCYAIAKAGKNDCGDKEAGTSCMGSAKEDRDGGAWIYVPKGVCDKIAGGSLSYVKPKED